MNRYYFVPVMDDKILHDGVSLRDHLKVVDKDLYDEEKKIFDDFYEDSYYDGLIQARMYRYSTRRSERAEKKFKDKDVPRFLAIVFNSEKGFYELSSEVSIDPVNRDNIACYEISGIDLVEAFIDYPTYTPITRSFFDAYEKNKGMLDEKKPKSLGKFSFFRRRNK